MKIQLNSFNLIIIDLKSDLKSRNTFNKVKAKYHIGLYDSVQS